MAFDQNSLTISHENAKYDEKIDSFRRKFHDVAEPYSMYVCLLFNVGRKKCPTWKRKNQNHTINVSQKVLILVVVTAQSKVSFVYGPGAVGFLPW